MACPIDKIYLPLRILYQYLSKVGAETEAIRFSRDGTITEVFAGERSNRKKRQRDSMESSYGTSTSNKGNQTGKNVPVEVLTIDRDDDDEKDTGGDENLMSAARDVISAARRIMSTPQGSHRSHSNTSTTSLSTSNSSNGAYQNNLASNKPHQGNSGGLNQPPAPSLWNARPNNNLSSQPTHPTFSSTSQNIVSAQLTRPIASCMGGDRPSSSFNNAALRNHVYDENASYWQPAYESNSHRWFGHEDDNYNSHEDDNGHDYDSGGEAEVCGGDDWDDAIEISD